MRPLAEDETAQVLQKLTKFIGEGNIKQLLDRSDDDYVFRLHNDRVYYVSGTTLKAAQRVGRKQLLSFGVCFGKFTHSKKFHLSITCLDYLSRLAKYRVWLKPNGEQHFLYGNNVVKAHLKRITEDVPRNGGVVIYSENDQPLGFGTAARTTAECRGAGVEDIVVYRMADVGDYLREESDLL